MSLSKLSAEEISFLEELKEKFSPIRTVDLLKIRIERLDDWYFEVNINNMKQNVVEHHPYEATFDAIDLEGNPLGAVIFYSENSPLSKVEVFRFDGHGPILVKDGSIKVYEEEGKLGV